MGYIVKISQKRYSAAGINFLQPLSASYSKQEKLISAVLDVSILLFSDYSIIWKIQWELTPLKNRSANKKLALRFL